MKMKNQHTPGPWHISDTGNHNGCQLVYGLDGRLVADAGRILRRAVAEEEANARLIAAAPDLAEALALVEGMLDAFPGFDSSAVPFTDKATGNIGQVIRAALAKAGLL